ncbi:MAG: FAD-dependent oxidoreductase [Sphingomonas sp.]|uniref:FAD-dependent oxidoreductase n=1 Tax=Sphingomonas sp. TaxID=28214 RepID=UPI00183D6B8D|nr:bifunctional TVP38/TMEM64 family protein/FAD-dependent oxidoreductase [Sphingomonas sp.]MBA3668305.1 FAD-dependent oxidoreductase [Sphingomonas sp.]
MSRGKIGLLAVFVAAIAAFFIFDLGAYLTLASLKARQADLATLLNNRPLAIIGAFFLLYIATTAFSLPGAAILTLAAGAVFGLWLGTLIVSFASAIGASLAFLSSRYVLRDWVKARFGRRVAAIDRGIAKDGVSYLLTLRLIPAFPFFLINLTMGLTTMRLVTFYVVSQIGMLPGTLVFVNAGTRLAAIDSTGDILSPALIGSFVLLGLFPLMAKAIVGLIKRRRVYQGCRRPRRFDRNLVVIGAGAGGLVTAYIAAAVRAKVTLVEAGTMGGDCLNTGCVPSKALIRSARLAHDMRHADQFGLASAEPSIDFKAVMARVRGVIAKIAPADSVARYTALGVDVRIGHATIVDPWTVQITDRDGGTQRLTTRSIVIAAGAEPFVPDIPGLAKAGFLTSDTMWDVLAARDTVPGRLVIVGGGPIGTEMAQAFARLGSAVTQIEAGPRILPNEDEEVSAFIADILRGEGVDVRAGHEAVRCEGKSLIVKKGDGEASIAFDDIIVAVGRKARLTGYGLEDLGIETGKTVIVDETLKTLFPNIFAVGDVAGPYQFTHFAAHQAWYAAVNALFGGLRTFRADYTVIPWTTFTDPEVAHVGHTVATATAADIAHEIVRYDLGHLDRAVAEGANKGFVTVLVPPGKDKILGVTIVAAQAGELLAEFVLAMKHGLGLNKILGTIHSYPTMAEANKNAAGEWKKANQPERLLEWVELYHRWRRK